MNNSNELLLSVLREAELPGDELAPTELLDAVVLDPDPIRALSETDRGNSFFEAMYHQFGFMRLQTTTSKRPPLEDKGRWVSLVRWLIRELREWNAGNDPGYHKLTVLFIATNYCDLDAGLWIAFPIGLEQNVGLLSKLEKLIASASVTFNVRGGRAGPIWEKEFLEKFKRADSERDWHRIGELWESLENVWIPNPFLVQTIRCLHRFGFEYLVRAIDAVCQTPIAMLVADALSIEQRLSLAAVSKNAYVQFACAFATISDSSTTSRLSYAAQQSLGKILLRVASDGPRWAKWMQVFNHYPLRFPAIQLALGRTLALAPEIAIQAYVEAVMLSTSYNDSRNAVAECLRSFRTAAPPDRCKVLWSLAFRRWSEWRFGFADKDIGLFKIGCSELDYAIVAYAVECMSDAERDAMLTTIHKKLCVLDNGWHGSITDCISEWNRLLSEFQPYARADQIIQSGEDWLAEGKQYLPTDLANQQYLKMMYGI